MIHSPDSGHGLVHMLSNNITLKFNYSKKLRPTLGHFHKITVLYTKLRYREKAFFMSPPPGLPRHGGGGLLPSPGGLRLVEPTPWRGGIEGGG